MPKKPDSSNPKCPFCNKKETVRQGYRKSKKRLTQKYQCKACKKHFTTQPPLQKYKTYPTSSRTHYPASSKIHYPKPPFSF